ncbi:MAG: restriction endonuclease subunit S [Lyngbya sp.]|nr:restriction endonuclease subunit S [Lyngbya sp.]
MKNWINATIGDLCKVIAGQSPQSKYYNTDGVGLPFYQGKKEFGDKFISTPQKWTTKITKEAEPGDILMSVRAPVGPINFAIEKICIGRGLAAIRAGQKIDRNFLFYGLLSKQDEIKGTEGAVFASINQTQIKNIKFAYPPLSEQQRIVEILDKTFEGIDRAIANTEKNLANARELFESYLNAIFTQKGDDWVEKKLGDVCHNVEYGTSSKSQAQGKIPVLRMGNVKNGVIDWTDLVYTSDQNEIDKYYLKYDDVLFNRTNSEEHVGKTAIYKGEYPAIFAGYLIRINYKKELLDADFLNFYLNSNSAREYSKFVMTRSVNQANINGTKLKGYPISIPSIKTQQEITKKLYSLRFETQRLEAIYQRKLEALQELKQSILHKAFTGELTNPTVKEDAA